MSDIVRAELAFGAVEAMQKTIDTQAARIEQLEAALREADEACRNPGNWNPAVIKRIIERVQEISRSALEGQS